MGTMRKSVLFIHNLTQGGFEFNHWTRGEGFSKFVHIEQNFLR